MSTNEFPVLFNSTLLTTSQAEIYAVPSSPSGIQLHDLQLKLTNVSSATRTVDLWAIPSGGSASDTTAIVVDFPIPPKDYVLVPLERLGASGTIEGLADQGSAVTIQPVGGKLHTP